MDEKNKPTIEKHTDGTTTITGEDAKQFAKVKTEGGSVFISFTEGHWIALTKAEAAALGQALKETEQL